MIEYPHARSEADAASKKPPGPRDEPYADEERQDGVDPTPCEELDRQRADQSDDCDGRIGQFVREGRTERPMRVGGIAKEVCRQEVGPQAEESEQHERGRGRLRCARQQLLRGFGDDPESNEHDDAEHPDRGKVLAACMPSTRRNQKHAEDAEVCEQMQRVGRQKETSAPP